MVVVVAAEWCVLLSSLALIGMRITLSFWMAKRASPFGSNIKAEILIAFLCTTR